MKEFDKIYLAKYEDILSEKQLAEDLHTSKTKIREILEEIKANELYEVYREISDEMWEIFEKKTDEYIKIECYKMSDKHNKKVLEDIIRDFEINIHEEIMKFPVFDEFNWILKGMKDKVIGENELWEQIPGFNYSLSNYGRIRNDKNGKLKTVRKHKWLITVDIYKDGKRYMLNVPRMEAELFIRHVEDNERVTFIDGDGRNLFYKNLKIKSK